MGETYVAAVITVSDRSARGERVDASGPAAAERLRDAGFRVLDVAVAPDGAESVSRAIGAALDAGARVVITSGGTGVGPRDETPEGTAPLIARELPGVAEELRRYGTQFSPHAVLSRGLIGVTESRALVANLPGSVKAVQQGLDVLLPLLPHVLDQLDGGDH